MYALMSQPRARRTSTWSSACAAGFGLFAITIATATWGLAGLFVAVALATAAGAAVVDSRTGRIPDGLVASALVPVGVVLLIELASGNGAAAPVRVAIGATVFGGPLFGAHLVAPDAIGFGDVKLAAALGAVVGLVDPRLGIVALCIACGASAAYGIAGRRTAVPLGPGLVLGAVATLVVAGRLGMSPLPWR